MSLLKLLRARVEKALEGVDNQIVLMGVGIGGVVGFATGIPAWICTLAFVIGGGGAYSVTRERRRVDLFERSKPGANMRVVTTLLQEKPNWRPKKFAKITHRGFLFDTHGFEEIPFPLAVSKPMCTQCEHDTKFKSFVDWRFRIRSKGRCRNCDLESTISGTAAELEQSAWEEVCPIVRTGTCQRH